MKNIAHVLFATTALVLLFAVPLWRRQLTTLADLFRERYGTRVAMFYKAIKAKYPQIRVSLSSWIAGVDQRIIDAAGRIDIVDEHAYRPLHWAIEHFDSFASYKRQGWDLYIGEFATNAGVGRGNVLAMLNDAAYMMSMEKNTDLVKMGSYAPLLENVNDRDWPVNMIHFDSSRAYARATYYANKLFAENLPTVNLATEVDYRPAGTRPITAHVGLGTGPQQPVRVNVSCQPAVKWNAQRKLARCQDGRVDDHSFAREWRGPAEEVFAQRLAGAGRTVGVGVLSPDAVLEYGVSGPIARASGVDFDLRRDDPYLAYEELIAEIDEWFETNGQFGVGA